MRPQGGCYSLVRPHCYMPCVPCRPLHSQAPATRWSPEPELQEGAELKSRGTRGQGAAPAEGEVGGTAGLVPGWRWRRGDGTPAGAGAVQRRGGHAPGVERWECTERLHSRRALLGALAPARGGAERRRGRRRCGGAGARLSWKQRLRAAASRCSVGETLLPAPNLRELSSWVLILQAGLWAILQGTPGAEGPRVAAPSGGGRGSRPRKSPWGGAVAGPVGSPWWPRALGVHCGSRSLPITEKPALRGAWSLGAFRRERGRVRTQLLCDLGLVLYHFWTCSLALKCAK